MGSDQLRLDLNQLLDLRSQLSLYLINLNLLRGGTFATHQVFQSLLLLLLLLLMLQALV